MDMEPTTALFFYKIACLAVGVFSIWLGYRLFVLGVSGSAADHIEAQTGRLRIIISRGAPGTVFTLLGVVVICYTVFIGMNFSGQSS